jgi:hypothetical protein
MQDTTTTEESEERQRYTMWQIAEQTDMWRATTADATCDRERELNTQLYLARIRNILMAAQMTLKPLSFPK